MPDKPQQPINIMEDAEAPPVQAKDLNQVNLYAQEMRSIDDQLYDLSCKQIDLEQRRQDIELKLLPDLMMAIGIKRFTTTTGEIIEIKDFCRGSIPTLNQIEKMDEVEAQAATARRNACLEWLRSINAESIIKNQVVAEFGKGQMEDAKKVFALIQAQGFKVQRNEDVNFQTLNAFLKGALEAGTPVPADPFQLFVGKKATIKIAK